MARILTIGAAALLLVGLSACTSPGTAIDEAVKCLQEKGVAAEVRDGVIMYTQFANDEQDNVPREVIEECLPETLRG